MLYKPLLVTRRSGARIIALALTFAVIPHMCGVITVYLCVWDQRVRLSLHTSRMGGGRFRGFIYCGTLVH